MCAKNRKRGKGMQPQKEMREEKRKRKTEDRVLTDMRERGAFFSDRE